MNQDTDRKSWDSTNNWTSIVLWLAEKRFRVYREIVLYMVPRVMQLRVDRKVTHWHFRWGGPTNVAFRLRSGLEHKDEVVAKLQEFIKGLKHLVSSCSIDLPHEPGWISSDEMLKQEYKEPRAWWRQVEYDELLSEIAYKILELEGDLSKVPGSLHNLLNMFGLQEIGGTYTFEAKTLKMNDESIKLFRDTIDWRKKRCIEKQLEARIAQYEQDSRNQKPVDNTLLDNWRSESEKVCDDAWESRSPLAIFFLNWW